jgi:carbon dioxide concentrating mechanism protein CcmO
MPGFGFIEVPFLSIAAVIADHAAKTAFVRVTGFETCGNENILIRLRGLSGAVQSALESASRKAKELGSSVITTCLAAPSPGLTGIVDFPNAENPLYGGRDQFLPSDFPNTTNTMNQQALGILETQGLTAALEATDAMLKSADVTLVGKEKIGAAYVTIIVRGDVAAVQAAVDAGHAAVGDLGKVIAAHVISRPHSDLLSLLPK